MAKQLVGYVGAAVALVIVYFVAVPGNILAAFLVGAAFGIGYMFPRR